VQPETEMERTLESSFYVAHLEREGRAERQSSRRMPTTRQREFSLSQRPLKEALSFQSLPNSKSPLESN
jgi:hypothetical protein